MIHQIKTSTFDVCGTRIITVFQYLSKLILKILLSVNEGIKLLKTTTTHQNSVSVSKPTPKMHLPSFCLHHPCVRVSAAIPLSANLTLCLTNLRSASNHPPVFGPRHSRSP